MGSARKAKFGGMDVSDGRKLKTLEPENARLKKIVAKDEEAQAFFPRQRHERRQCADVFAMDLHEFQRFRPGMVSRVLTATCTALTSADLSMPRVPRRSALLAAKPGAKGSLEDDQFFAAEEPQPALLARH